jgi:hypothetical protein
MSRKHFVAMAKELADIADLDARKQAAKAFADVAKAMNSRFDYTRFYEACGL